jgi:hypothetical protein
MRSYSISSIASALVCIAPLLLASACVVTVNDGDESSARDEDRASESEAGTPKKSGGQGSGERGDDDASVPASELDASASPAADVDDASDLGDAQAPLIDDPDEWSEFSSPELLFEHQVEATNELAAQKLERAYGVLSYLELLRLELPDSVPAFVMRTRPIDDAVEPVDWLALGGEQQLVNLYLGFEDEEAGCMFALMPDGEVGVEGGAADGGAPSPQSDGGAKTADGGPGGDDEDIDDDEAPKLGDPKDEAPVILMEFEGVRCGTISTIRSLLKMGWIKPADAVKGKDLKQDYVKGFDKYLGEKGLSPINEEKAHKDHTPSGKTFKAEDFHINHLTKDNDKTWDKIKKLIDDGWDCNISYLITVKLPDGGTRSVGHGEMVTKVSRKNSVVTVEMEDALDQGSDAKGIKHHGKKKTQTYPTSHKLKGIAMSPISVQCYGAVTPEPEQQ